MNEQIDVIRRVYAKGEKAFLEVRPWPDAPDTAIELHSSGEVNEEYWGKFFLTLSKSDAQALGEALIAAANELRS